MTEDDLRKLGFRPKADKKRRGFLQKRRYYVPTPEEVLVVEIVEKGTGGRNFRRSIKDPHVVRILSSKIPGEIGTEMVVAGRELYRDPLAAASKSEKLLREADS